MALEIPPISDTDTAQSVAVSESVFGQKYNEGLVHQLVTTYLARARYGNKQQKSRSQVAGGGAKPWRQKGTGNARSGTNRSPIWRTGGVTFAARPRSFDKKFNKKMYRVGIRSILSELLRQQRVFVSADIIPSGPKTKEFVRFLKNCNALNSIIVIGADDKNLSLASRNVVGVEVCTTQALNPVGLINSPKTILTQEAIKIIEERLG